MKKKSSPPGFKKYSQGVVLIPQDCQSLQENIYFMWLTGSQQPIFRTTNRFRSQVMKGVIEDSFTAVLELLLEEGYVKLENYFLDRTKIEANAT